MPEEHILVIKRSLFDQLGAFAEPALTPVSERTTAAGILVRVLRAPSDAAPTMPAEFCRAAATTDRSFSTNMGSSNDPC